MQTYEFTVDELEQGYRLDKFIYDSIDGISRSRVQALISEGLAFVNAKRAKKSDKVKDGDIVIFSVPEAQKTDIIPEKISLDIVYEDDDVIVVNKPSGMVVHPAPGNYSGTLVNALMYHFDKLPVIGGEERPGIVHRIDRETSGLVMVAKNDFAHNSLSGQLKARTVGRLYNAIAIGAFKAESGTVDVPIARDKNNRLMMAPDRGGRKAVTHYKLIENIGNYSFLEFKLDTGRTHQIRVHMKYLNHPLVGDRVYGIKADKDSKYGQMLHAKTLEFEHPRSGIRLKFGSDLPDYFVKCLEKLRRMTCR